MPSEHERPSNAELLEVLAQYDVGEVSSIQEFVRGSRRSPKFIVETPQGKFLLKRRAKGKDDPVKVAFAHALQNHLALKGFPLPRLIGTQADNNSMLQWHGRVYELFEYVDATAYDGSLDATYHAGRALAMYHKLVRDYHPQWVPPRGSYYDSDPVRNGLNSIPTTFASHESVHGQEAEVLSTIQRLREIYDQAAEAANELGLPQWEMQIVHSDFHPGNVLFRSRRVVAVLDYDAARIQPRVTDLANGTLQFSIIGGQAPSQWPDFFDESRVKRFLRGYDEINTLTVAELRASPYLMIEALVAEAVVPIAATGSFGDLAGFGFLQMVQRKAAWLQSNAERLGQMLEA
jgi:homoserine kinase type II